MPQGLAQLLGPGAQARGLDLKALLAIASHEGASGRIGDNGHAFGPFQLNDAGGVLTGKLQGLNPAQKNAWAWSPQGIAFAEDGIAKVARGEHGAQAIRDIATRFERPANVAAEISDASARYGLPVSSPAGSRAAMSVGAPRIPSSAGAPGGLLGSLLNETNASFGLGDSPLLGSLLDSRQTAAPTAQIPHVATAGRSGTPGLESIDGVQVDRAIAPTLAQLVQQFKVTPTSGYRDPSHNAQVGGAANSDHLRGDAVDFAGNPSQLAALYKYAQGRYPYVEPMGQAKNHVHISFKRP